jgi:hypothetical protein
MRAGNNAGKLIKAEREIYYLPLFVGNSDFSFTNDALSLLRNAISPLNYARSLLSLALSLAGEIDITCKLCLLTRDLSLITCT